VAFEPLGIEAIAAGVANFVRDLGRMDSAIQRTGGFAQQLGSGFLSVGTTVAKATAGIGAAAVAGFGAAAGAITKLAIDAAPLEGIIGAFNGIAEAAGVAGPEMLRSLRESSAGMVANRDLMLSFNNAASLVSVDFAKKLPDAMQHLVKISAATGDSMDFLLNSLVTGIGRVSPQLLDNLKIQVSIAEGTEEAAKMFGVQASELTKTQQQAGLMAVTMRKLEAATKDMPEVAGSLTQQLASLRVVMQNTKDDIGIALRPAFKELLSGLTPLIQQALPALAELFKSRVVPAVERVVKWILSMVEALADAGFSSIEFREALTGILPEGLQQRMLDFLGTIDRMVEKFREFYTRSHRGYRRGAYWRSHSRHHPQDRNRHRQIDVSHRAFDHVHRPVGSGLGGRLAWHPHHANGFLGANRQTDARRRA